MTSANNGLRIEQLAMNFGGVVVFEDVSIEVPPGKVTACIGPNGAGKTTIINIVCGMFPPKAGNIFLDGVQLKDVRPFDTVRHGLCRSFQDVRIFPSLTALENLLVAMPGQRGERLRSLFVPGLRRQERANRDQGRRLLQTVALESAADRSAGELPFGQQKLLSLLRAIATGARVLLLDEPAAGVEAELIPRIVSLVRGLVKAEGRATFLVEHNIDLVRQVADRVCVLQGGRIIAAGDVQRVLNDENVIREYLGRVYDAEAREVSIAYGAFEVVHCVSIAVGERQIVGLFGHNGAGKSSLLKGIYGVLPIRAGNVIFAGDETTNQPPYRQATRGMRFVPQEGNVFPNLTVEDNLRMGALRLAGDNAVHAARFDDVYETFPILRERGQARAHVLSGGERQMLAVSIALMTRPKLLLLDEPSAGLAPLLVERIFETIRTIRDRFGMSVLLVEQNVNEALRIVDEVCVLEEGRAVFTGAATDKDQIVRRLWRLDNRSPASS